MIIGFRIPHKFVYHYTKLETASDHILKNRTLKIDKFTSTNDPKETKDWDFSLFTEKTTGLLNTDVRGLSDRLSTLLKARTKVVCFSHDQQPLSGDHTRDIFLRGWSKPRMWAQYARNHTGVCLVFDRQALDEAIVKHCGFDAVVYRRDVAYVNQSIIPQFGTGPYVINCDVLERLGIERYAQEHLRVFVQHLFFEKMLDWRDEAEFRWVVFSKSEEDLLVEITSSLKGIIFGDRCPEKSIDALIEATEDLDLEYMGLKWHNSSPWYDFGTLRYSREFRRLKKADKENRPPSP